jgi:hypothetical protein
MKRAGGEVQTCWVKKIMMNYLFYCFYSRPGLVLGGRLYASPLVSFVE